MNLSKYNRQAVLPEIGNLGQSKISNARILCIGAGGLGAPTLLYLAAAGIGSLGIIDFDKIDVSNLQRQIIYKEKDLKKSKAETAKQNLLELNSEIQIKSYDEKLTSKNALKIFDNYDIIIDGSDNFSTKFLANDAAVKLNKPLIYGSILGFDGQISIFDARQGPCYRCLYKEPPKHYVPNCSEAGILGPIAGIVGSMQAAEAIKLIVSHKNFKPLIGKLGIIDGKTMEVRKIRIKKNINCPTCSINPKKIELIDYPELCLNAEKITVKTVSLKDAQENKDIILIDVREKYEAEKNKIKNSLNIPLSDLLQNCDIPVERFKHYAIFCSNNSRSKVAISLFLQKGFNNLYTTKL